MAKIFINYRREDSQYQAGRLRDLMKPWMEEPLRDIFIDVANIPAGLDLVEYLDDKVKQCDALIVIIGNDWLTIPDAETGLRRLDNSNDFVRIEIESALKRDIPVVPVLLDGVKMPATSDLPDSLKPLVRRNGVTVSRLNFENDVIRLMRSLPVTLKEPDVASEKGGGLLVAMLSLMMVAGLSIGGFLIDPLGWFDRDGEGTAATAPVETTDTTSVASETITGEAAETDLNTARVGAARGAALEIAADDAAWERLEDFSTVAAYCAYLNNEDYSAHRAEAFSALNRHEQAVLRLETAVNVTGFERWVRPVPEPAQARTSPRPTTSTVPAVSDSSARRAGETFRDALSGGRHGPEMVVIPSGSFVMGSPASEVDRGDDEGPVRTVRIRASFAVGKHQVTWDQWEACVAAGGCDNAAPIGAGGDEDWGRGSRPVVNVDWNDAQAYVAWLSQATGESYRLLSEAEWEYVARAGTQTPYWWGRSASHEYANYGADQCCEGLTSGRDQWVNTSPVGAFSANAFGLHDMHGNVYEWTQDCWNSTYSGARADGSVWESWDCPLRVVRGGSWRSGPQYLRSANRDWEFTEHRHDEIGFRVASTL